MDLEKLSQQDLQKLFQAGCFFLLDNLPIGSEFSIDGSTWTVGHLFKGIKLIPPGFHIITITINPENSIETLNHHSNQINQLNSPPIDKANTIGIGYQIKNSLIRFFNPQEICIRSYDSTIENFQSSPHDLDHTIVSLDYMKSIDSNLAPYPLARYHHWKSLTNWITPQSVAHVIHFNQTNDAFLDNLMSNHINLSPPPKLPPSQPNTSKSSKSKTSHSQDTISTNSTHQSQQLQTYWPFIDLKRSWPKDSVGTQLTKWSRDKSWLFDQLISHQLDHTQLLGLIQLSFLTFIHVHSIQSFEFYQSILNLITRSTPQELFNFNPHHLITILESIKTLNFQLAHLEADFFSTMEDPQIENWFFGIINKLRVQLHQIKALILSQESHLPNSTKALMDEIQIKTWIEIQSSCRRFDWNVQPLKVNPDGSISDESDDDDDEFASDNEDEYQPVVVQT